MIAPLRVARDTWPAEIEKWDHLSELKYGCGTLVADTENIDDNKGRIVWRCLNGEAL